MRDASAYDCDVDPSAPNSAHSFGIAMVGSNKRVLEVGCAAGHVTRVLAARGCTVTGIEIDPVAARVAAEFARDVIVADLDVDDVVSKLEDQRFDVVLMGDVLEHLRDPLTVLRSLAQLVEPDGSFVVSLPNIAHVDVRLALLEGRFEYSNWGLLDRTHLRFFTKVTGERLLRDAGLLPIELERVFMPPYTSEIPVDQAKVAPQTLESALADPEAETYQFVWRAVPDNGSAATRDLAARCEALEQELRRALIDVELGEARCSQARAEQDRLVAEVGALQHEVAAINSTKLMRHTRRLRAVYRSVVLRS